MIKNTILAILLLAPFTSAIAGTYSNEDFTTWQQAAKYCPPPYNFSASSDSTSSVKIQAIDNHGNKLTGFSSVPPKFVDKATHKILDLSYGTNVGWYGWLRGNGVTCYYVFANESNELSILEVRGWLMNLV